MSFINIRLFKHKKQNQKSIKRRHEFFFLISEKGQPFSLTQNTETIKVNTDKCDYIKKTFCISTHDINGQMTNNCGSGSGADLFFVMCLLYLFKILQSMYFLFKKINVEI